MTGMLRALLDTSVVIDLDIAPREELPVEWVISALTLAELAQGPHATDDPAERAIRQQRLQWVEATFDPLPFDAETARAYGVFYAALRARGRRVRGRVVELQIAAVAVAHRLPVLTRNPDDFAGLAGVAEVHAV